MRTHPLQKVPEEKWARALAGDVAAQVEILAWKSEADKMPTVCVPGDWRDFSKDWIDILPSEEDTPD